MTATSGQRNPTPIFLRSSNRKDLKMRLFAALATVTIILGGCDGNGASEEESRSGTVAERGDE